MFAARRPRLTAWIAALAVMLAALAPTLTHAVSWVSGTQLQWVEVCTVAGVKLVAVQDDGETEGGLAGLQADHCPYCCPHAGSFALPPDEAPALHLAGAGQAVPQHFLRAPGPHFIWASAQPRAPPIAA